MNYEDPQVLYDALKNFNDDSGHIYYWNMDVLQGLTDLEQKVIFLKYMKGISNQEIIRVIKYNGSVAGLRQICSRVRKKLIAKYPFLEQK